MHIVAEAAEFLGSGASPLGAGFLVLGAGAWRFSPAPIPGTRHLTPDTSPYCASPAAAFLLPLRLAHRQGMLSRGFWRNFLRVGKNLGLPAVDFLPVGNGAASLPTRVIKRPNRRTPRASGWFGRLSAQWLVSEWRVIRSKCPGQPVAQTAGFAVCGSSLTRATQCYGVAPAREETRTTEAVVGATC